jgi:hypothetical protein
VGNEPLRGLGEALEGDFRIELAADNLAGSGHQPIKLAFARAERIDGRHSTSISPGMVEVAQHPITPQLASATPSFVIAAIPLAG